MDAIRDESLPTEKKIETVIHPVAPVDQTQILSQFKEMMIEKDRLREKETERLNQQIKEETQRREKLMMDMTQNRGNSLDGIVPIITALAPLISGLNKKDDSTEVMMKLHQMQQEQARENLRIQQENQKTTNGNDEAPC